MKLHNLFPGRYLVPNPAYSAAIASAGFLWSQLDDSAAPRDRQALYDELSRPYAAMAASLTAGEVPAGYDGYLTADLMSASALCWVLARSEHALAGDPDDQAEVPYHVIPGASTGDARLAAAWRLFWGTRDRNLRAALLRGHHGGPARKGEQRNPSGIIPLTTIYTGSAVTGFLEQAAASEATAASRLSRQGAAR